MKTQINWQDVVDTEKNRWVSWNAVNLMTSWGTASCSRRTQLLGVTIKYSLYYFAHKISIVVSLWWPRLCEIGYLYTMCVAMFCQAVVHCSPHNTEIPFFFVWIIPQSTCPIQMTSVGLNIGRMYGCYLLVYYSFLHENRDDIFKTHSRIQHCVTPDLKA